MLAEGTAGGGITPGIGGAGGMPGAEGIAGGAEGIEGMGGAGGIPGAVGGGFILYIIHKICLPSDEDGVFYPPKCRTVIERE